MSRMKTLKTVISFYTTADAMAFEKAALSKGIPGRLMPTPREISADCGFAWASEQQYGETLKALAESDGLKFEAFTELMLF